MKAILSLLSRVLRLFFGATICAAGLGAAMGQTPEVANVTIAQRAGTKLVDVRYDLTGAEGQTYVVKVDASRDGGSVFEEVSALSGAVGPEVTPGAGKTGCAEAGAGACGEHAQEGNGARSYSPSHVLVLEDEGLDFVIYYE